MLPRDRRFLKYVKLVTTNACIIPVISLKTCKHIKPYRDTARAPPRPPPAESGQAGTIRLNEETSVSKYYYRCYRTSSSGSSKMYCTSDKSQYHTTGAVSCVYRCVPGVLSAVAHKNLVHQRKKHGSSTMKADARQAADVRTSLADAKFEGSVPFMGENYWHTL